CSDVKFRDFFKVQTTNNVDLVPNTSFISRGLLDCAESCLSLDSLCYSYSQRDQSCAI
ncbi:hypothetical protein BgiMline_036916, partial [Biomphalaria glabrata]